MKSLNLLIAILLLFLAACAAPATAEPSPTPPPATTAPVATPTKVPKLTISFQDNAQVELVTPSGRHLYIDVYDPSRLIKTPSADDILLTTHTHDDHVIASFQGAFPGQQLFTSEGRIELPDVTITGLASAHNSWDPIQAENASDYIYIIDIAGLRIAHFGDIGQDALTESQLAALGTVDIAITQFSNSYSSMNAANMKGFNLMDQVKPRLIVPTHADKNTIEIAAGRWKGYYSDSPSVSLSKDSLPAEASLLVLGNLAPSYGAIFKLTLWK